MRSSGVVAVVMVVLTCAAGTTLCEAQQASDNASPGVVCPVQADAMAAADLSAASSACNTAVVPTDSFCASCICGVGTALVLGLDAAGVRINGQPVSALAAGGDASSLNSLIANCSGLLGGALLQSGALSAAGLAALSACDVAAASISCATVAGPAGAPAPPAQQIAQAAPQPAVAPVSSAAPGVSGRTLLMAALAHVLILTGLMLG